MMDAMGWDGMPSAFAGCIITIQMDSVQDLGDVMQFNKYTVI